MPVSSVMVSFSHQFYLSLSHLMSTRKEGKEKSKNEGKGMARNQNPATKRQHSQAQVEQKTGGQERHTGNTGAEQSSQQIMRRKPIYRGRLTNDTQVRCKKSGKTKWGSRKWGYNYQNEIGNTNGRMTKNKMLPTSNWLRSWSYFDMWFNVLHVFLISVVMASYMGKIRTFDALISVPSCSQ